MGNKSGRALKLLNKGIECADRNDFMSAKHYFEKTLNVDPNYSEAHYSLGLLYLILGNKTAAQEKCGALEKLNRNLSVKLSSHIEDMRHN